ncbi:MAG: ketopantoate reductase family protein [Promethearchaeota archaeon]
MATKRFVILGMGAVGSILAFTLHESGHNIIGICRGEHYKQILDKGLQFERFNGNKSVLKCGQGFSVFNDYNSGKACLKTISKEDWVIITAKAYSIDGIIREYTDFLGSHGSVVLLQNGIGNEEIVKERIQNIEIFRGTTTMGAFLVEPGYVRHTGKGFTNLGYPNINYKDKNQKNIPKNMEKKVKELVDFFCDAGISTKFISEIDLILWEKIFINVGINAPAAIRNIPNGLLVESPKIMEQMKKAIVEAWSTGKSMGVPLEDTPEKYIELTYDVARKTAFNKNSMLQDLMRGKPTEIDFINGKIVDYAHKLGLNVPENEKLTEKIKKLEH